MPTFKADFARYDPKRDSAANIEELIEQYNALIRKLSVTINHLDEENFGAGIRIYQEQQEEEDG